MNKKSRIIKYLIVLSILISVSITFYKTIIKKDFILMEGDEIYLPSNI